MNNAEGTSEIHLALNRFHLAALDAYEQRLMLHGSYRAKFFGKSLQETDVALKQKALDWKRLHPPQLVAVAIKQNSAEALVRTWPFGSEHLWEDLYFFVRTSEGWKVDSRKVFQTRVMGLQLSLVHELRQRGI